MACSRSEDNRITFKKYKENKQAEDFTCIATDLYNSHSFYAHVRTEGV